MDAELTIEYPPSHDGSHWEPDAVCEWPFPHVDIVAPDTTSAVHGSVLFFISIIVSDCFFFLNMMLFLLPSPALQDQDGNGKVTTASEAQSYPLMHYRAKMVMVMRAQRVGRKCYHLLRYTTGLVMARHNKQNVKSVSTNGRYFTSSVFSLGFRFSAINYVCQLFFVFVNF